MTTRQPVDVLRSYSVQITEVDGSSGDTNYSDVLTIGNRAPLVGQIAEDGYKPPDLELLIRDIENGGVAPAFVWQRLENLELELVSTRFTGAWAALLTKEIILRASADLRTAGASRGYFHESKGIVMAVPETWQQNGDALTTVRMRLTEHKRQHGNATPNIEIDILNEVIKINGVDIMQESREARGV